MAGTRQTRAAALGCISLGAGIMVSPDTLVRLGQFTGHTGLWGLGLLAGAMVLLFFTAPGAGAFAGRPGGRWTYLPLTVRCAAALFLPTGMLVSSGFVFNEVFVYWFPNFGFAFVLLFLVLAVSLLPVHAGLKCQVAFTGLCLACLVVLAIAGMAGWEGRTGHTLLPLPPVSFPVLALPLLLWVGIDMAGVAAAERQGPDGPGSSGTGLDLLGLVIAGGGIIFLFWATVSALHVPPEKLSGSGIPHMRTARAILGDTGRYVMGSAVILGTLAGGNALFTACRISAAALAREGRLPGLAGNPWVVPVLLAAGVGLMMGLGMAGSETLELWIEAVCILWVLGYAGVFSGRDARKKLPGGARTVVTIGGILLLFHGDGWLLKWGYAAAIIGVALVLQVILSPAGQNRPRGV